MAEERSGGGDQPATHLFAIIPNDNADLTVATRAIWVGGAGNVNVIALEDGSAVLLSGASAGQVIAVRTKRVLSTSTSATLLVGMY